MQASDYIAILAIIISIGTFLWNEYKDRRDRKEKSLIDLAITSKTSLRFGIADIGRELKEENAFGVDITIMVHNTGNANAVINRIFLVRVKEDGNYEYFKEYPIDIESERIINPGKSLPYYFSDQGDYINEIDKMITYKTGFFRVFTTSGKYFDSPRD
ncbi:hypothetical protein [Algoriphagus formosus]|uniref:hypothetical protein n=1 Tax=Algoriphagus formosus TaxID=2007308 RepID=UPI003F6FD5B0